MSNFNAANSTEIEDKNLSVDKLKILDPKKQTELLSDKDDDILNSLLEQSIVSQDFELAATIRDTLKNKVQQKTDENDEKIKQEMAENRNEQETQNSKKVEELKKMLEQSDNKFEIWNKISYTNSNSSEIVWELIWDHDSDPAIAEWSIQIKLDWTEKKIAISKSSLESNDTFKVIEQKNKLNPALKALIEWLIESHENNREETSWLLKDLKEAKRKWDTKRIDNFKRLLKEAQNTAKSLQEKYKKETVRYPEDEIATMDTKLIKSRWISKKTIKTEDWRETTIKRPSLKINKNRRSRRKLNQVVKAFNGFKKESDSAVKYILTQERWNRLDNLIWSDAAGQSMNRWRYSLLHNSWFVMSKVKFEEKFDKQQKKIIDKFKNNINPSADSDEGKTIKALEDRMKYYKQDYLNKHY